MAKKVQYNIYPQTETRAPKNGQNGSRVRSDRAEGNETSSKANKNKTPAALSELSRIGDLLNSTLNSGASSAAANQDLMTLLPGFSSVTASTSNNTPVTTPSAAVEQLVSLQTVSAQGLDRKIQDILASVKAPVTTLASAPPPLPVAVPAKTSILSKVLGAAPLTAKPAATQATMDPLAMVMMMLFFKKRKK